MVRWEFLKLGRGPWLKAMIHYFPPNVTDRDPHDHPRDFVTLILKGGYFNTEWEKTEQGNVHVPTEEWLGRGAVRVRRAEHMHTTETLDAAAWTLVVMGPEKRAWGFLRNGRWWAWKPYVERFGGVVRCGTGEIDEGEADYPPYRDYKGTSPPPQRLDR